MPTPPRRWPMEVEAERDGALQAATEATQLLQSAQATLDTARAKIQSNQSLTTILLADTDRAVADATTRMERIKRHLAVARATPLNGRWPMVATKQRDDADEAADQALGLLHKAQEHIGHARAKVATNPGLGEAMIADVGMFQAKALTQAERIMRLLTEAGIGRD